jgi:hypothetical protein
MHRPAIKAGRPRPSATQRIKRHAPLRLRVLTAAGYHYIGLGQFVRADDDLKQAQGAGA